MISWERLRLRKAAVRYARTQPVRSVKRLPKPPRLRRVR